MTFAPLQPKPGPATRSKNTSLTRKNYRFTEQLNYPLLVAIQAKVGLGAQNSPLESEAERLADLVLERSGDIEPPSTPSIRSPRANEAVTQFQISNARPIATTTPANYFTAISTDVGRALPLHTRRPIENTLGYDFSGVRIHTDLRSSHIARSIGAEAFTVGNDIAFGPGRFRPNTPKGLHLLTHELVHTAQQRAATPRGSSARRTTSTSQHLQPRSAPGENQDYLNSILEELVSLHPSFRDIKNNLQIVAFVASEIASGAWGNEADGRLGKALAQVRLSTEDYAEGFDRDAYRAKEGPRVLRQWQLESSGSKSITFYPEINPGDPSLDKGEEKLKEVVEDRKMGKWTDFGQGADTFKTIVSIIRKLRSVVPSDGFLREVVLTGHGVTESRSDGTTVAGFASGREWIDTSILASYPSNHLKNSLAPGATVDLVNCDIAKVDKDKRFRWEVGRIFFGETNWGYIKAYSSVTGQYYGATRKSLKGHDPEVLLWPVDFPQYQEMRKKAELGHDDPTR